MTKLSSEQRRKATLEALARKRPVKNIATDYGVYPGSLYYWIEEAKEDAEAKLEEAKQELAFREEALSLLSEETDSGEGDVKAVGGQEKPVKEKPVKVRKSMGPRKNSRRPRFSQAIRDFMNDRGIRSLTQLAKDFIDAGYPEPDKMYQQKLDSWLNTREAVPDIFFRYLNKAYRLTPQEKTSIMDAYARDVFHD